MDIIRKEDGKCPDPKTLRRWKKRYLVNNELVDDLGRRQKSFKDVEKSVELKKQNSETNETANQQKDSTKTIDDQNDIIEIPTPLISPEAFSQLHRQLEYLTIIGKI
uniref:Transposase n=1 Tax=Caenorhabditis tropicalis TaxID=1561998 RepID=A0A1I7TXH1_9PELO